LPEVVDATLALPVGDLIADGEAIALRPDRRPHRFQVTASRFGRSVDVAAACAAQPLSVFFFDVDWQTARFTELAVGPADASVVRLRPEQVVEVAVDGVQKSPRCPGGLAFRFARVVRYRDDTGPADADTIDAVRAM
jgi:ATP-dependent DNA ligase